MTLTAKRFPDASGEASQEFIAWTFLLRFDRVRIDSYVRSTSSSSNESVLRRGSARDKDELTSWNRANRIIPFGRGTTERAPLLHLIQLDPS
jgi:hypothetical protein